MQVIPGAAPDACLQVRLDELAAPRSMARAEPELAAHRVQGERSHPHGALLLRGRRSLDEAPGRHVLHGQLAEEDGAHVRRHVLLDGVLGHAAHHGS
ncbi:hypothetical protein DRW03_17890 [Corallococcus sp. H22C18031201]|nr:hypothetical protein DRW03_17890 [Corallococcus sp. H22C18031201]